MPALGEVLIYGYPPQLPEEQIETRGAELDIAVQGLYQRMFDLAPLLGGRHALSRGAVTRESPMIEYSMPGDPQKTVMAAWLTTTNWKTGSGPFRGTDQGGKEVKLITRASHPDKKGKMHPESRVDRVVAAAGKLTIFETFEQSPRPLVLSSLRPYAAANIITDIDYTLNFLEYSFSS